MAAIDVPITGGHAGDAHGDPDVNYLKAKTGIWSWLSTIDHKRIGLMYLTMVALAFLAGGVFALLVRLELFSRGKTIVDAETYNRLFTLHGAIMVFLFIIPSVPAALGNFFLPIMIGAKDVAFPRLNLFSYYIYLVGAAFSLWSIVAGSVDTGWTFYTPYSVQTSSSVIPMTLGVFILGFSSILTGLNFLVTVHTMRAPGITWTRMPLFVWGMYATALIQVLATPVLAITLLLLCAERFFGIGFFDPKLGGDPVLFQHFFWFYSHPAVYIMIVPGMAIVSELIATFTRRAIFGQFAISMSSLALAVLGFLVWGHHLFVAGMSEFATMLFSALTFLVAIPSGVKVFNWTATIYKGSVVWASPMLYAMAFIFLFTIGGLTGLFLGTLSVDVHLTDTYFVVAHFHYVMMGGTVIGFLGGLLYWWPKMTGKMHDERKAKIGF
ncbi:MAG: cbb3-type cytochrome c oxidase subunit I, partial [Polyangiaceae bacterium]|nr:cbb3-type cytochrome c oxidase subunit I [Polyangiaceae bacterium]